MPSARLLNQIKKNLRDRTFDLPFFFRAKHTNSLITTFRLHKARACRNGLGASLATMFVLIY